MVKVSRPLGLFLIFLLLLVASLVAGPPSAPAPNYDPAGNGPDGLLLLREWLVEMGYTVSTNGSAAFDPGAADLLIVYPGVEPFSRSESDQLAAWVEKGGTLVLVDTQDGALQELFDFSTTSSSTTDRLLQSQPLLPEAAAVITGTNFARRLRLPSDFPGVTLLSDDSSSARSALAVLRQGKGWVWLLAADFSLTNERLTDNRATAQIVPALLRSVPDRGRVIFDTYHLFGPDAGQTQTGIGSLQEWAYTTPTGWGTLFLFGLALVYLLLQGRRLGPPILTLTQGRRREAAEFVVAMAGLQRRSNLHDSIARHQRRQLKQRVGRPWQLAVDLPDDEFVARLAAADPAFDADRLRQLLKALTHVSDEASLVKLTQEAAAMAGRAHGTDRGAA